MSEETDGRPRPQFGEYASPEEQRARIRTPEPAPAPAPEPAPPPVQPVWGARGRPGASGGALNRLVTIALLLYGGINVALSAFSFLDLPAAMDSVYDMMGIPGSFTDTGAARTWGIVAGILLVAGFVATVWASVRTMRRGRLSWWIPLVGAAVTYLVVSVCIAVPMMNDPALMSYLTDAGTPS